MAFLKRLIGEIPGHVPDLVTIPGLRLGVRAAAALVSNETKDERVFIWKVLNNVETYSRTGVDFGVFRVKKPGHFRARGVKLSAKIQSHVKTIMQKAQNIINNTDLPYFPPEGGGWSVVGNQDCYKSQLKSYDNMSEDWRSNGCPGDPPPLPAEYRTVPQPRVPAPGQPPGNSNAAPNVDPAVGLAPVVLFVMWLLWEGPARLFPPRNLIPA